MRRHFVPENIGFKKGPTRLNMKRTTLRFLSCAFLLIGTFSLTAFAQATKFMTVDEMRPGMKGYGKPGFQGTKMEQLDVELLVVLKNVVFKEDMILAVLSGGPLVRTVVNAGVRGGPVDVGGSA